MTDKLLFVTGQIFAMSHILTFIAGWEVKLRLRSLEETRASLAVLHFFELPCIGGDHFMEMIKKTMILLKAVVVNC